MTIANFYFVLISTVVYFITFFCVIKFKKSTQLKHQEFPTLKVNKNEIFFTSYQTHRIKIKDYKIMKIENVLYLNLYEKLIIISNIKDVKIYNGFLYFTALGEVKILVDMKCVFKYFAIQIKSKQFSIDALKQQAILDFMNNGFNINFSKILKKYIKIIEKVLKINIFEEKIVINANNLKLSFVVSYKVNNKIKCVNIR